MQRTVVLGIVLAQAGACGFSGSNGGAIDAPPIEDDAPPPPDATDAPMPDAPIDGSQIVDTDNDTIVDAEDNCPTVGNPQQRNYDEDPRGDACDPCPHLANQDDDPDGDNIGVGCDPRPDATDQRLLWTAFYDASAIVGWTFPSGTWTVDNSRLRQTDANADFGLASPPLGANLPRVAVATRYTLDTLGPLGDGIDSAGLGAASANTTGQYYACLLSKSVVDTRLWAAADWPSGNNTDDLQSVVWPGTFATGSKIDLVHDTLTTNTCVARQGGTTVTIASDRGTNLNGVLYLYSQRAAGSFEYIFVVGIGN